MKKFWICLLLCVCLFAEEAPKKRVPRKLRGIVLVDSKKRFLSDEAASKVRGVRSSGFEVPGTFECLKNELRMFLLHPYSDATVDAVEQCIIEYYRKKDRPFVLVEVPKQNKKTSVLQVLVHESSLGAVLVADNKWSKDSRYLSYFAQASGQGISEERLNSDIDFINRNPFRYVNVMYAPGIENYTTDLTLMVQDRRPYFFYGGFDNTGVPSTGRERVYGGFSWNQMFGLDHVFSYQYSTNYNEHKFHANSFQYTMYLPWKHIFNFYGGFSSVTAQFVGAPMNNSGYSAQGSFRYVVPFWSGRAVTQEFMFGADYKHMNNTAQYSDTDPVLGQAINIAEFMLGYKMKVDKNRNHFEGSFEMYCSPAEFMTKQTKQAYASLRPHADTEWTYFTTSMLLRQALAHSWCLQWKLMGEATWNVLLPSEQMGIGGFATVRGYDEHQYNGDIAGVASLQLETPHIGGKRGDAYFLVFADCGAGFDNARIPGVPIWDLLASAGAGFRCVLGSYLNGRVDYGWKLRNNASFGGGNGEVHFAVSGSF